MAVKLTDLTVKNWAANDKRQEIADVTEKGLYLVVQPEGPRRGNSSGKSWAVRYRHGGRPQKFTIGEYPRWSLQQARDKAREVQRMRTDPTAPQNPREVQEEARRKARGPSASDRDRFQNIVERYLHDYASKRRGHREKARLIGLPLDRETLKPTGKTTKGRAIDIWGQKRIQDITRRDVREYVEGLAEVAPIGANRVFAELRKFFNWAVSKDILAASPMTGMAQPSEEHQSRERTLLRRDDIPGSSDDELRWLWKACGQYDRVEPGEEHQGNRERGPFGPCVQLLMLTGQRRSEVAGMTDSEIDYDKRQWTIPGSRTKNGKPQIVPLSDAAMKVLASVARVAGKAGYVFSTTGASPISGWTRTKRRLDKLMAEAAEEERGEAVIIPAWTLHDLRRTLAAGMQRLGIKREVTEKVINHTSGSFGGIVGVYQVYDYADEKRAALDAWSRFVMALVRNEPASNVVPIRSETPQQ